MGGCCSKGLGARVGAQGSEDPLSPATPAASSSGSTQAKPDCIRLQPLQDNPSERGVSVRCVLDLYRRACEVLNEKNFTTKQLVEEIVKPDTLAQRCCLVEHGWVKTGRPRSFISHTWHRPFKELVLCLAKHFAGHEEELVWLDIFAFNQHMSFSEMADDLATLSTTVSTTTAQTLVVIDAQGVCFTRAWCLLEYHTATTAGGNSDTGKLVILPYVLLDDEVSTRDAVKAVSDVMFNIDVREATAFQPEDKDAILASIDADVGIIKFNTVLKDALAKAVAAMGIACKDKLQRARADHIAAGVLEGGGHYAEAQALAHSALQVRRDMLSDNHADTAESMHRLGWILSRLGRDGEAEGMLQASLEAEERLLGVNHRETAETMNDLALVLQSKGELAAAETLFARSLEARRELLGEDHADLAEGLNNMALLAKDKGVLNEALELMKASVRTYHAALGELHPQVALCMANMATLYEEMDDMDGAECTLRQVLDVRQRALGEEHPDTTEAMTMLASNLYCKGDLVGARAMFSRACAVYDVKFGNMHPKADSAHDMLALVDRKIAAKGGNPS